MTFADDLTAAGGDVGELTSANVPGADELTAAGEKSAVATRSLGRESASAAALTAPGK